MRKYMTNLNHQINIDTNISNSKFSYFDKIENFQKKEEVVSNNSEENVNKIKEQWKNFLETKNLTPESYNEKVVKEQKEKIGNSLLKRAKNKKELKLLVEAKKIVLNSYEKVRDENPEFEPEQEILDFYTIDIFEKLKPEINKNEYVKSKDIHKGNYYSRNVYSMITKTDPWYLACHEYFRMNINDNADENNNEKLPKTLNGYRLADMVK